MARQKWEQILGALFHGAQSALPLYFQMMEQREAEAAQAQAEEEAKAEDQQKVQDILAIMAPVLGTTFPEKGYSMLGPEAVPGGQPIYPEGGVPTQAALSLFGRAESGDMDPGWLMYLINLLEGRGGMYEPAPEPEQPINPETLAMIGELMGITGTRPFGYGPQEVRGFGEALDQDWGREVELAMQQPDILRSLFEAPEAGPDEADRIAAEALRMAGFDLPEGQDASEYLSAIQEASRMMPEPALPEFRGGPSTGGWVIDEQGNIIREYPPIETGPENINLYNNVGGIPLVYEDDQGVQGNIDIQMNDALASAFYSASDELRALGIASIQHAGSYNVREARTLAGEPLGYQSTHAQGLALDIKGFYDAQGTYHPVTNQNDPLVRSAQAILNQFPDYVNEGPVWHVGIGAGRTQPRITGGEELDWLDIPRDQVATYLQRAGATPKMIAKDPATWTDEDIAQSDAGNPPMIQQGWNPAVGDEWSQTQQRAVELYRQDQAGGAEAAGQPIPELSGLTRDQMVEFINEYQPQTLEQMVEVMLYVQALGIDDPPWWDLLTVENKRKVHAALDERTGNA